jgi:hypothetical protein
VTTTRKRAATPAARTDLLDRFVSFPSRVEAAIRTAAPRPPIDGEWTPQQVVRHLIAVETVVHQARLLDVAVVDGPVWTWTEPGPWEGEPDLELDGVLARYAELRADTVARIRALDEEGWRRAGTHATYGKLDVAGLLELATAHDDEHLQGLEAR